MASGFMADRETVTPVQQNAVHESATDTGGAASDVRGIAGIVALAGVAVACVPVVSVLGLAMLVIGALVWLMTPATKPAQAAMVAESAAGGGCRAGIVAGLLAAVVMALAGAAALVLVLGGGL